MDAVSGPPFGGPQHFGRRALLLLDNLCFITDRFPRWPVRPLFMLRRLHEALQ